MLVLRRNVAPISLDKFISEPEFHFLVASDRRNCHPLGHVDHRKLSGEAPWVDSFGNRQPADINGI